MPAKIIIAGPGTGKTTSLINEISQVLQEKNDLKGMIICTFTRRASEELLNRLYLKLDEKVFSKKNILIGTIHSICFELLKNHAKGKYLDYQILSEDKQIPFIHSKLENFGFHAEEIRTGGWQIAEVLASLFNKITDEQINLEVINFANNEDIESYCSNYTLYIRLLHKNKFLDFALIQKIMLDEITLDSEVFCSIRSCYNYFFVDEYQDVNNLQNELIMKLSSPEYNLTVVGDDDQSIYGFRGAKVTNFLNLENHLKTKASQIHKEYLSINYRSTREIIKLTNQIVANATYNRLHKVVEGLENRHNIRPVIKLFANDLEEAEYITLKIQELVEFGAVGSLSDIAILLRSTKGHSAAIVDVLSSEGIPFVLIGTGGFFETEMMREYMLLMDFYLNDSSVRIDRLNVGLSGLDLELGMTLQAEYLQGEYIKKLEGNLFQRDKIKSCISLLYEIMLCTDFFERYEKYAKNIGILTSITKTFDEFSINYNQYKYYNYLNYLRKSKAVDFDTDEKEDAVNIMTIHQAKGLEFSCVFMPSQNNRLVMGTIIDRFNRLVESSDTIVPEEERRVFYVAATRAKEYLMISSSSELRHTKKMYDPVKYINELKREKDIFNTDLDIVQKLITTDDRSKRRKRTEQVLSYNKIKVYLMCPKMYKYAFVYNLQTAKIGGMQFGNNLHRAIEKMMRNLLKGEPILEQNINNIMEESWDPTSFRSDQLNQKFLDAAKLQLNKFAKNFGYRLKPEDIFSIEDTFNTSIGDIIVTGRFDLCLKTPTHYEIIDFKTGDELDYTSQLSFYEVCFKEKYDLENVKSAVYYLRSAVLKEITPRDPQKEIDNLFDIATKIKEQRFPANPSNYCADCAFNNICKERR